MVSRRVPFEKGTSRQHELTVMFRHSLRPAHPREANLSASDVLRALVFEPWMDELDDLQHLARHPNSRGSEAGSLTYAYQPGVGRSSGR
jgi:hypothetical protein